MPRLDVEGMLERKWAPTVVFIGLVLLSAGIKWVKDWPVGALIVLGIGAFYWLVPIHRWPVRQLWLVIALVLCGLGLQAVAADINSPVSNLGTTLIVLNMAGGAFSPVLLRPRWSEAFGPPEEAAR